VQLNFTACPGATFALQRSSNFRDWQDIGTVHLDGNAGSFSDAQLSQPTYYRLKVISPP